MSQPTKTLHTLQELDRQLAIVEEQYGRSLRDGDQAAAEFEFQSPWELPADPDSDAYRAVQMMLYRLISSRTSLRMDYPHYEAEQLRLQTIQPFPYNTGNPAIVGTSLIMQGWLALNLWPNPPARVIEYSAGWGNVALQLAGVGYEVTAVESDPNFAEVIRHRSERLDLPVTVVETEMLDFQPDGVYDIVLFFDTFHRCFDFQRMLEKVDGLLSERGRIIFAMPPLRTQPYPWGVRLDGPAIRSARLHGKLELAFDESFFLRTLMKLGWLSTRAIIGTVQGADLLIARRSHGCYLPSELLMPPDEAHTWHESQGDHRFTTASSQLTCDRTQAVDAVEFCISNFAPFELEVRIQAGNNHHCTQIKSGTEKALYTVSPTHWDGTVRIDSATWRPSEHIIGSTDRRELGVAVYSIRLIETK